MLFFLFNHFFIYYYYFFCIQETLSIYYPLGVIKIKNLHKAPTSNSCKTFMQDWLWRNNVPFDTNMLKVELYSLIKTHKPLQKLVPKDAPSRTRIPTLDMKTCRNFSLEIVPTPLAECKKLELKQSISETDNGTNGCITFQSENGPTSLQLTIKIARDNFIESLQGIGHTGQPPLCCDARLLSSCRANFLADHFDSWMLLLQDLGQCDFEFSREFLSSSSLPTLSKEKTIPYPRGTNIEDNLATVAEFCFLPSLLSDPHYT
ncbi:hypothetical protein C0J52_27906 [Blattella germanica]|nr:hypothetical protein C0J52_27906 [Blattella germanica]